jgi:hypothetical protein
MADTNETHEAQVAVAEGSFNAEWTFAELSSAVCDALVDNGKLKVDYRDDREVKITKVLPPCL